MFVLFTSIALIAYAVIPNATLDTLLRLIAFDVGASCLLLLAYPHVRGIKKGDRVFIVEQRMPIMVFGFSNGIALEGGRIGSAIRVELFDRSVAVGTITKYEGIFSNAEIKLLERTVPIEIRK